jgi:molecular chaperone GrpE
MGDEEEEKKLLGEASSEVHKGRKEKPEEESEGDKKMRDEEEASMVQNDIQSLKKELEEKTKLADDYYEKLLRAKAEMDNIRKRVEKEMCYMIDSANEALILDLLSVTDSFEEALKLEVNEENLEAVREGNRKIYKQLMSVLEKNGLTPIEALGRNFDPFEHEAIIRVDSDEAEDKIVEEVQKGYKLNSKVIRPSKVCVSRGKFEDKKVSNIEDEKLNSDNNCDED